MPLYQD
ncbi:uncharacterized protein FFNC_15513 [Fusarium fujikuroi]|nr:uncharacterized protein FFNC_15513 [Fusarium fujikuroi]